MSQRLPRFTPAALLILLCASPAGAELRPDEIVIIAVRHSKESKALAQYYAKARNIPDAQICLIDVVPGKTLSRARWQDLLRPMLRRWLAERRLHTKVRCLVTVWDVPLVIAGLPGDSKTVQNRQLYLEAERSSRIAQLQQIVDTVRALPSTNVRKTTPKPDAKLQDLAEILKTTFTAAQQRLVATEAGSDRQQMEAALNEHFLKAGGLNSMIQTIQTIEKQTPEQRAQAKFMEGQLQGLREGRAAMESLPESVSRDSQLLKLIEKSEGIIGSISWIDGRIQLLKRNETQASFDSELSLLFWPEYPLMRWQPNVLHSQFDESQERWLRTTLMVSRLEAPTTDLVKQMIDTAIRVEQEGLKGSIYFDARGLKATNPKLGSYEDYDESVRRAAHNFQQNSDRKVVLDNAPELFAKDACPDVALYCGWYSLGKYVDSFKWNPGAVAYHIASAEATTLRNPKSTVWCKRMLEEGVCATLGPAFEPYLHAFPRPDKFFPLLASGKYSLVECYYRTKPFNSWAMVLVGDPLYTPFKNHPAIQFEDAQPPKSGEIGVGFRDRSSSPWLPRVRTSSPAVAARQAKK